MVFSSKYLKRLHKLVAVKSNTFMISDYVVKLPWMAAFLVSPLNFEALNLFFFSSWILAWQEHIAAAMCVAVAECILSLYRQFSVLKLNSVSWKCWQYWDFFFFHEPSLPVSVIPTLGRSPSLGQLAGFDLILLFWCIHALGYFKNRVNLCAIHLWV